MLSIYNKKTKSGRNSRHIRAKFDLGGGSTKIADINIRSIQAAPEEESGTIEEQSVAVAVVEESMVPNSAVDDGVDADAVAVPEDDATPSSTADTTTLDCAQSLLGDMNITDDNNGTENAVEHTNEKAPNAPNAADETEQEQSENDTVMLEDNDSNANPPAEMTVQEESSPATDGIIDTVHDCEWYEYDNVDHIPLNGKVPKKKWGIRLHSGEILYQNGDIQHMYSPLDYFLMSFPNEQIDLCLIETNN